MTLKRSPMLTEAQVLNHRRCAVCGARTALTGYRILTDQFFCDAHLPERKESPDALEVA